MIYINECTDCGKSWYDDGVVAYRVQPWERTSSEWSIEPVLCNVCLRVSSRARAGGRVCLSSTLKVKEIKNEQNPQHDSGNNTPMVSDKKTGRVRWRRLHCTARIAGWLGAKFRGPRQPKKDNQND